MTTNQTIGGNKTFTNPIVGSVTGNAATVTTNANLTGPITSVGNVTTITNGAVTDAKIAGVAASKITGTLGVANGGTGQTTISGIKSSLGLLSNEIAIGDQSGLNSQGQNGIAIGGGAGRNAQGLSAIGIGYVAGYDNQGANGIAIGSNTAQANQAVQAVAVGYAAGQYGQGQNAVALGAFAGNAGQAANSIAINASGQSSPLNPTNAGLYISPIRNAGGLTTILYYNSTTKEVTYADAPGVTSVGAIANTSTANGASITSGVLNLAPADATNGGVVTTGSQTFAGAKTFTNDIVVNGVKIGRGAGNNEQNVAIGADALASGTGTRNTAVGYGAMRQYSGTSFDNNTSVGYFNLISLTSGSGNTSVGAESMLNLTTGTQNTSIGNQSLINTTGNENVGVGKSSGDSNTTGSQNTFIGTNSNASANNLSNATALGYGATVASSNTIQLGNTSVTNVKTSGTLTADAVTYPRAHGTNGQVLSTTGSGTLTWITPAVGLPTSGNTAGDMLYWNGSAWVKVAAGTDGQTLTFIGGRPVWSGSLPENTVVNATTGKIWMDRNLGASQVATSSTDHLAYGSLYQWGRGTDGHELVNWIPGHVGQDGGAGVNGTTSTLSSTDTPGNSRFIITSTAQFVDWRSGQNNNLWQGVNGINNPCPSGFRIPTGAEWSAEIASWSSQNNTGAFASPLKLTMAGQRNDGAGFFFAGQIGYYWSSTTVTTKAQALSFSPSNANLSVSGDFRGNGYSIRCIRN
jgi:uncharacterized protein (TIGR02145 family)